MKKNGQKLITCEKAVLMKVAKGFFLSHESTFETVGTKKKKKFHQTTPFWKKTLVAVFERDDVFFHFQGG